MKLNDLTGEKFGRLTVLERAKNHGKRTYWKCLCDCGREKDVGAYDLTSGKTKSCGCYSAGPRKSINLSESRLYQIWEGMISRCENKNKDNYQQYGARGICVCAEWHDFCAFMQWSLDNGYADYLTIDRKSTNGNYCPENCRWVSWETQNNNRRNNRVLEIAGVKMTITQASGVFGVSKTTVYDRLSRGWSMEKALGVRPGVVIKLSEIVGGNG